MATTKISRNLTRAERIRLTTMMANAGWETNARKGVAVALLDDPTPGRCGMITFRFSPQTGRDMLAGTMLIPAPMQPLLENITA